MEDSGQLGSLRVYFAVFGSGLGHVTRVLSLADMLGGARGDRLFSSSGQGFAYLRAAGRGGDSVEAPPLDVKWAEGGFASWHVLPHFPSMFNAFLEQVAFERRQIARFAPKVVVSDSKLSPIFAARAKGYPAVTILNQFVVAFPPRFRGRVGRFYERIAGDALGLMWSLSDRILLTDLPPPYTISEANVAGTDLSRLVEYVGFTTSRPELTEESLQKARRMLDLDRRPLVFCQISGPDQTKGRLGRILTQAARGLSKDYNFVLSLGYSGGAPVPKRLAGGGWIFEWCPVKDELFELADLVVARAGHSTIGQCVDRSKPAVMIPIYNHPEQIGNAEKASRLGLGVSIRSEDLTPDGLAQAARGCLNDPSYRSRAEGLRKVSMRYRGLERCSEVIRAYA